MPGDGIYYLTYPRQGKTIIRAGVIQVSVIDTNSPFSSHFLDHNHVFQPIGILNFSYKPNCQQLIYFNLNDLLPIRMKASDFLSNRSWWEHDIKPVWGYGWVDPEHVRMGPHEDVFVLLKYSFEGSYLF